MNNTKGSMKELRECWHQATTTQLAHLHPWAQYEVLGHIIGSTVSMVRPAATDDICKLSVELPPAHESQDFCIKRIRGPLNEPA